MYQEESQQSKPFKSSPNKQHQPLVYPGPLSLCRVVLSRFLEFVQQECSGPEGGIPVLVAHNGKAFDYKFLSQECNRWNVPLPGDWQWLDSLLLAKECVRDPPGETVSRALVGSPMTWQNTA